MRPPRRRRGRGSYAAASSRIASAAAPAVGTTRQNVKQVAGWFSALTDDEAATLFELLSRLDAGVPAGDG